MPPHRRLVPALSAALAQRAATALRLGGDQLPWRLPARLRHDLAGWREADDLDRSALSAHIKAKALNGAYGERIRRRAVSEHESTMPKRLRDDLRQALEVPDPAARRTAVDRIVQDINGGAYGRTFQRRTVDTPRSIPPQHRLSSEAAYFPVMLSFLIEQVPGSR